MGGLARGRSQKGRRRSHVHGAAADQRKLAEAGAGGGIVPRKHGDDLVVEPRPVEEHKGEDIQALGAACGRGRT